MPARLGAVLCVVETLTVAAGILAGCAQVPAPITNIDVVEATFRYEFQHNESGKQSNVGTYCIRVNGQNVHDPTDGAPPLELIARLSDVVPTVKPQSACRSVSGGREGVKDRSTGKSAILFNVSIPKCSSDSVCEVEGGYYEASESASGDTYYLEKHDGKWTVVRDVERWLS